MAETSRGAGDRMPGGAAAAEIRRLLQDLDETRVGEEMRALITELFPICRSITGAGLRQSLRIVGRVVPLAVTEVPSGTAVFDWVVPREWNIRGAWVKGPSGEIVIDFQRSNLHVLNYSSPFRGRLGLEELKPHLHSLPERPSLVPYRTSYYKESWGFCVSHDQLEALEPGEYEVLVDSSLEDGSLTYAEHLVQGATEDEILVSCHCCHPSLCNDNLSGVALTATLSPLLRSLPPT